jgi:hypothetical protein
MPRRLAYERTHKPAANLLILARTNICALNQKGEQKRVLVGAEINQKTHKENKFEVARTLQTDPRPRSA